jgi:hypothetical protein
VFHSTPSEVQDLPPALPYPDSTIQHLAPGRAVQFQLSVIVNLMKTIFSSRKTPKILVFLQTTKPWTCCNKYSVQYCVTGPWSLQSVLTRERMMRRSNRFLGCT